MSTFKPALERFPRLATFFRVVRDSSFVFDIPRKNSLGFKIAGHPEMEKGTFEPEEVSIVKRCLKYADTCINIGANVGYYCCISLLEGRKTIAFEPNERNLRYLFKNIDANGWKSDIEIFPLALGNTTGLIDMYGGETGASLIKGWAGVPENFRNLVPISTLDLVLGDRMKGKNCFFLVDIEGAESQMLAGAGAHLALVPKPIWMVEIAISEHQPKGTTVNSHLVETFDRFWAHGYEAYTAEATPKPVSREEIEKISRTGIDTFHTHNFLFIGENNRSLVGL